MARREHLTMRRALGFAALFAARALRAVLEQPNQRHERRALLGVEGSRVSVQPDFAWSTCGWLMTTTFFVLGSAIFTMANGIRDVHPRLPA